jgi:hypothetical protein
MSKSEFFKKENLEFSRDQIVVKHSTNPEITFKKVGLDYVVITQNSQNICIYRDQLTSLGFAIQEIGGMIADEESQSGQTNNSVSIDLLVAGKLNEHQENPNMEFEPKTPTLEDSKDWKDVVYEESKNDAQTGFFLELESELEDKKAEIEYTDTKIESEEKIETIIVSDIDTTVSEEISIKKPKAKKSPKKK